MSLHGMSTRNGLMVATTPTTATRPSLTSRWAILRADSRGRRGGLLARQVVRYLSSSAVGQRLDLNILHNNTRVQIVPEST